MFAWWGRTVYRFRYIVIGVMVALCLGGAVYGSSLGEHVTQSGYYNEESQSVQASVLADKTYGRDRNSHVVAILTPPSDGKVTDPAWQKKIAGELDSFVNDHKDKVLQWVGWLKAPNVDPTTPVGAKVQAMKTADLKHTFVTIPIAGDDDDSILKNYQSVAPDLRKINGGNIKLAGMEPLASELTGTIGTDQKRAEIAIIPLVCVVLFFVFGGAIAAALPAIIGGLTIGGALGILRLTAEFGPVHFFAQPVVTMMGFGIAIDYGLFIVSRFREELADGYDVEAAVRRSVMTSGRTVAFSAVIIVASSLPLLLIPLGFLRSITYAIIASVLLAAFLSNTVLPAVLGILGTNIDALGVRTLLRVPFLANWPFSRKIIDWFAEKTQKTKTREEVEKGFWGRLVNVVMKRPLTFALPIVIAMILLVIPIGQLALGGLSEKYLPPDNGVRMAQEEFDKTFPGFRTDPLTLVIKSDNGHPVTDQQIAQVKANAATIDGFVVPDNDKSKMWGERDGKPDDPSVRVLQNALVNANDVAPKLDELRALQAPHGLTVLVGGTPALAQDSISTLFEKLPLMAVLLVVTTTILMFLAFGSLVLPIKAALMSALTLGSTMGILTWMFVESGHGSGILNYTPQPLLAPMIGLIIAVIWGLSTDYEVFLVSRMVEARERGMSTAEAIRIGTATTGRLITGAALVLAVVVAAFAFSDLVVMKYLAFGLLIALLLDATVIRMFLVPAVMKLLGDDCWWAPLWMKRVQQKLGLGETELPDERKRPAVREPEDPRALVGSGAPVRAPHDPTHPAAGQRAVPTRINPGQPQPPSQAPTNRMPSAPPQPPVPQAPPVPPQAPPASSAQSTEPAEPATTRFSAAKGAFRNVVSNVTRAVTPQNDPTPPTAAIGDPATTAFGQPSDPATTAFRAPGANRPAEPGQGATGNREIESWLGQLRGNISASGPQIQTPSDAPADQGNEPTTAFRAQPAEAPDATEKIDTGETQRRGTGGGVSAADLLRREGRL